MFISDVLHACETDSKVGTKVYIDFGNAERLPVPMCSCSITVKGGNRLLFIRRNAPFTYACGSVIEISDKEKKNEERHFGCMDPPSSVFQPIGDVLTHTAMIGDVYGISILKLHEPFNTSYCIEIAVSKY